MTLYFTCTLQLSIDIASGHYIHFLKINFQSAVWNNLKIIIVWKCGSSKKQKKKKKEAMKEIPSAAVSLVSTFP